MGNFSRYLSNFLAMIVNGNTTVADIYRRGRKYCNTYYSDSRGNVVIYCVRSEEISVVGSL